MRMSRFVFVVLLAVSFSIIASDCYTCGGTGLIECNLCDGSGCGNECSRCDGAGVEQKECLWCSGEGYSKSGVKCYNCKGTGTKIEKCLSCNGTGCGGKCFTCCGTGQKKCTMCPRKNSYSY